MNSKVNSLEEKVKLPPTETISRCYQPQNNRKVIRILTVAVYVLCVSLAAIMLSLYYIFIWDPTIRPFVSKSTNCEKTVIPEKIAIRLLNSSEVTAEQFYKLILEQYRVLHQMQLQRQQYLQQQQRQLQQLAAGNKFQEIFATATIIQANPNDPIRRPVTPTNGTFLLEPRSIAEMEAEAAAAGIVGNLPTPVVMPTLHSAAAQALSSSSSAAGMGGHSKRKPHRRPYSHNHRHNPRRSHRPRSTPAPPVPPLEYNDAEEMIDERIDVNDVPAEQIVVGAAPVLNPPTSVVQTKSLIALNTPSMSMPMILNSKEDSTSSSSNSNNNNNNSNNNKRNHRGHSHGHSRGDKRGNTGRDRKYMGNNAAVAAAEAAIDNYETPTHFNPFLHGELIFEK